MPENKLESFNVSFNLLPYLAGETTPEKQCESTFLQCRFFVGSILEAITLMNDPLDSSIGDDAISSTHNLALIGDAFLAEMHNQFQNLLEITEAEDEQSK